MEKNKQFAAKALAVFVLSSVIALAMLPAMAFGAGDSGTAQSGWTTITNTDPDSGEYGKSYKWRIASTVTVSDGIVTDVVINGKGVELPNVPEMERPYFTPCHELMEAKIIDAGIDASNPEAVDAVDIVSGATHTSYWIKVATKEALVKWNDADISKGSVAITGTQPIYASKPLTPAVTVKTKNGVALGSSDYSVVYSNNTNVGTATAIITGKGSYRGSKTATFTIAPAAQTIAPAKATYTVKFNKVKKKNQAIAVKFNANGGGKITYGAAKSGKVSIAKNGKVTVKKGTKKKTYALNVKVTAAATGNYKATTVTVPLKVKVA